MLLPNNIQEVKIRFEPLDTGIRDLQVNIVDTKNRILLERWAIHTTSDLPVVSKTYDLPRTPTLCSSEK